MHPLHFAGAGNGRPGERLGRIAW